MRPDLRAQIARSCVPSVHTASTAPLRVHVRTEPRVHLSMDPVHVKQVGKVWIALLTVPAEHGV